MVDSVDKVFLVLFEMEKSFIILNNINKQAKTGCYLYKIFRLLIEINENKSKSTNIYSINFYHINFQLYTENSSPTRTLNKSQMNLFNHHHHINNNANQVKLQPIEPLYLFIKDKAKIDIINTLFTQEKFLSNKNLKLKKIN